MIEIRADSPDNPPSAEQPLAIAEGLRKLSVMLYRATLPDLGGLSAPLDVYNVLGSLSAAIDPLDSTLQQMHRFVTQTADAALAPDQDFPGARILDDALSEATAHARQLARCLRLASSGIGLMPPPIGTAVRAQIEENIMTEPDDETPPA